MHEAAALRPFETSFLAGASAPKHDCSYSSHWECPPLCTQQRHCQNGKQRFLPPGRNLPVHESPPIVFVALTLCSNSWRHHATASPSSTHSSSQLQAGYRRNRMGMISTGYCVEHEQGKKPPTILYRYVLPWHRVPYDMGPATVELDCRLLVEVSAVTADVSWLGSSSPPAIEQNPPPFRCLSHSFADTGTARSQFAAQ